jgi:hypothetical protein
MKKIIIDNKILIIEDNKLSIGKKRLIKITDNEWKVENYLEDICKDITLVCTECIFYKDKCTYQEWKPGLKEGRRW